MLEKAPQTELPELSTIVQAGARTGRRRRWLIAAGVLVVLGLAAAYWLSAGRTTASTVYFTAPVTTGDLTVKVTATGTVEPINQVEVSSQQSGLVRTVSVDYNDTVTTGQVLATLDTDRLDANVTVAEATVAARTADVQQAQVTSDEATAALKRAETLIGKQAITEQTFDTAKATADRAGAALLTAKANLNTANANLTIARNDRAKADILSPIDGVVLSRSVEVGQTVAASLQAPVLFTLAENLAQMQLEVDVDEADVGKIASGNTATFTVAAHPGREFPATITLIRYAPETVEGVVTYKAVLSVDNSDLLLRPGMTATADIVAQQVEDVLQVPNAALRFTPPTAARRPNGTGLIGLILPRPPGPGAQGRTTSTAEGEGERKVYVLRNNAPVAVTITTGATDGTHTAVVSGDLKEGDKVIVGSRTSS